MSGKEGRTQMGNRPLGLHSPGPSKHDDKEPGAEELTGVRPTPSPRSVMVAKRLDHTRLGLLKGKSCTLARPEQEILSGNPAIPHPQIETWVTFV
jgi:hypothetical protein